jgi:hypothetical protein
MYTFLRHVRTSPVQLVMSPVYGKRILFIELTHGENTYNMHECRDSLHGTSAERRLLWTVANV